MPMQPRPMTPTTGPLLPSVVVRMPSSLPRQSALGPGRVLYSSPVTRSLPVSAGALTDGCFGRISICASLVVVPALRACCARHQQDRRGSCLWADDVADDAGSVAAVLGAVCGVDLVVDVASGGCEGDVLIDAA